MDILGSTLAISDNTNSMSATALNAQSQSDSKVTDGKNFEPVVSFFSVRRQAKINRSNPRNYVPKQDILVARGRGVFCGNALDKTRTKKTEDEDTVSIAGGSETHTTLLEVRFGFMHFISESSVTQSEYNAFEDLLRFSISKPNSKSDKPKKKVKKSKQTDFTGGGKYIGSPLKEHFARFFSDGLKIDQLSIGMLHFYFVCIFNELYTSKQLTGDTLIYALSDLEYEKTITALAKHKQRIMSADINEMYDKTAWIASFMEISNILFFSHDAIDKYSIMNSHPKSLSKIDTTLYERAESHITKLFNLLDSAFLKRIITKDLWEIIFNLATQKKFKDRSAASLHPNDRVESGSDRATSSAMESSRVNREKLLVSTFITGLRRTRLMFDPLFRGRLRDIVDLISDSIPKQDNKITQAILSFNLIFHNTNFIATTSETYIPDYARRVLFYGQGTTSEFIGFSSLLSYMPSDIVLATTALREVLNKTPAFRSNECSRLFHSISNIVDFHHNIISTLEVKMPPLFFTRIHIDALHMIYCLQQESIGQIFRTAKALTEGRFDDVENNVKEEDKVVIPYPPCYPNYLLGLLYWATGDLAQAELYLAKSYKSEAMVLRGMMCEQKGDFVDAFFLYERASRFGLRSAATNIIKIIPKLCGSGLCLAEVYEQYIKDAEEHYKALGLVWFESIGYYASLVDTFFIENKVEEATLAIDTLSFDERLATGESAITDIEFNEEFAPNVTSSVTFQKEEELLKLTKKSLADYMLDIRETTKPRSYHTAKALIDKASSETNVMQQLLVLAQTDIWRLMHQLRYLKMHSSESFFDLVEPTLLRIIDLMTPSDLWTQFPSEEFRLFSSQDRDRSIQIDSFYVLLNLTIDCLNFINKGDEIPLRNWVIAPFETIESLKRKWQNDISYMFISGSFLSTAGHIVQLLEKYNTEEFDSLIAKKELIPASNYYDAANLINKYRLSRHDLSAKIKKQTSPGVTYR